MGAKKAYEQKLKDACQRREPCFSAFRQNNAERKVRRKKNDVSKIRLCENMSYCECKFIIATVQLIENIDTLLASQKFKTASLSKDPAANSEHNNRGDESQQQSHNINCSIEEMINDSQAVQRTNHQVNNGVLNDLFSNDSNGENQSNPTTSLQVAYLFEAKWVKELWGQNEHNVIDSNLEAAKHRQHHSLNFEGNRPEQQEEEEEHDRNPSKSSAAANFYRVATSQKMIINQQMEKEGASDEKSRSENFQTKDSRVEDDVANNDGFANKPKFKREIASNILYDDMNKRRKLDVHGNNDTDNFNTNANNNNILAPNITDKIVSTTVINFQGEDRRPEKLDKNTLQKKPIAVLPARTLSPSRSTGSLTNGRPTFLLSNRNSEHPLFNDNNVRLLSPKKELLTGRTPPSSSSSSFTQTSDSLLGRTPSTSIPSCNVVRPPSISMEKINNSIHNPSNLAPFFLQQQSIVPPPPSLPTFQPSTAATAVAAHFPTFLSPLTAASLHNSSMLSFANNMPRLPLIPIDTQVVANNPALYSHTVVPNIIPIKKKGKWCALHVQIAWDIHNKIKQKHDKTNNNNCQSQQQQPSTSSSCSSITEGHPSRQNSRDFSSIKNNVVSHRVFQSNPKIPVQNSSVGGQRSGQATKSHHHHHHHHHHHKESSSQPINHSMKNKEKGLNQEISRSKRSPPAVNGYSDQGKSTSSIAASKTTPPDPQTTTNPAPPVVTAPLQTANHTHQQDMSMLNAALNNLRAAADMGGFFTGGPAINFGQQRAPPDAYSQAAATFALFQSQLGTTSNPHLMQPSPMNFGSPEMIRVRPPFLTPSTAMSIGALAPATSFDPHTAALANLYANLLQQRQYEVATAAGLSSLPPGHNAYVPPLLPTASSSSSTTQDLLSRLFMAYHQQQQPPNGGGILDPSTRQALAAQLAFLNGFSASPLANGGGAIRPPQLSSLNRSPSASSSSLTMQWREWMQNRVGKIKAANVAFFMKFLAKKFFPVQ
uniref:Uncharacterized protein n=1 Tax=Romanomermis culicivorax TaxID=13658 RepID=A0A915I8J4_ROMCU